MVLLGAEEEGQSDRKREMKADRVAVKGKRERDPLAASLFPKLLDSIYVLFRFWGEGCFFGPLTCVLTARSRGATF